MTDFGDPFGINGEDFFLLLPGGCDHRVHALDMADIPNHHRIITVDACLLCGARFQTPYWEPGQESSRLEELLRANTDVGIARRGAGWDDSALKEAKRRLSHFQKIAEESGP